METEYSNSSEAIVFLQKGKADEEDEDCEIDINDDPSPPQILAKEFIKEEDSVLTSDKSNDSIDSKRVSTDKAFALPRGT
jgi:hypothetical protein